MTPILWSTFLGVWLILLLGAVLALVALQLPRLLARWETPERTGLEDIRPASLEERAPARATPAAEPLPKAAPLEDSLVAAAIALALSLYQGEAERLPGPLVSPGGGSSWALAGRWQAMHNRLNLRKR